MKKSPSTNSKRSKNLKTEKIDENKLEKIDEEIKKNKIRKKNKSKDQKIQKRKKCIINIFTLIFVTLYILLLISGRQMIPESEFISDLINFSFFFLIVAIVIFEFAYKKDSFEIALFGIEALVVASLTVYMHDLCNKNNEKIIQYYIYIIGAIYIYYTTKIIIILAKRKKK